LTIIITAHAALAVRDAAVACIERLARRRPRPRAARLERRERQGREEDQDVGDINVVSA